MQANTLSPKQDVEKRFLREESPPCEAQNANAVVAITGVSGYLGRTLASLLDDDERVKKIVGIDCQPCPTQSRKLRFCNRSVTDGGLDELFVREGVTHVAHLAACLAPNHRRRRTREINVVGTSQVLAAAARAQVRHLVYASSSVTYGAHPDNPIPIPESHRLRPARQVQYTLDKVEAEGLCGEFREQHPEIDTSIVRVVTIVGPAFDNFIARFWSKPFLVAPRSFDPSWQFVHELDAARAFSAVLFSGRPGIYNLGADDPVRFSEIRDRLRKPAIRLPRALLKLTTNLAWYLRLKSMTEIPALIDYLCYPPVLSNDRLKQEIGFEFQFTSREAIFSYVDALHASWQTSESAPEPNRTNNHSAEDLQ